MVTATPGLGELSRNSHGMEAPHVVGGAVTATPGLGRLSRNSHGMEAPHVVGGLRRGLAEEGLLKLACPSIR
jgi:hypothetical protein